MINDPVADMLTRIRNANMRYKERVDVPSSKLLRGIVSILKQEGFIRNYRYLEAEKHGILRVYLKYGPEREKVIQGLRRVSKLSVRRYVGKDKIPRVLNGLGIAIISTSRGLMTDKEARRQGVGGEVLCEVW